jgi:CheY-like chemotaxis protein
MSDSRLRRILFVDDDPNILTALKRQLRRKFEIETCDDSTRALDVIESQGPFAVVISDLRMKGLDGLEFLKLATSRNPDSICRSGCRGTGRQQWPDLPVSDQALPPGSPSTGLDRGPEPF